MNAISIILQIALLLLGSYLWMRYFSASSRTAAPVSVTTTPLRARLLSVAGIIMMIVGLSGISSRILTLVNVPAADPTTAKVTGAALFTRILLGSVFSGITAGLSCLLMRFILTRRERARFASKKREVGAEAGSLNSEV
jgi:hypothetical protein